MASNSYVIKTIPPLWSTFYNPSIYCAIRGMLSVASNSYVIKTIPPLWSPFYNPSIYCAIRGMLLVASNSYIIKTYHFYGLLFTIPL